ncbi:hypothetical protein GCM10010377_76660 [Streptomyces viridiviolaceus]|uniref:Uncharacterized protein n=1 Tax=Streptomyces viridiviolaceus TaxID=68282 RepID=A0ABW2EBC7_9ACTN|nr:hypothetical protein [Streptomyces viridiviolaceus]GHB74863.1 hypothetical protein GCM10010377_76660 [Streptomyces viridiviolaceus]
MSAHIHSAKTAGGLLGFLVGGAGGFLLTEAVGGLVVVGFDRTLNVDGTPPLLAAFIAVPILAALAGATIGARKAGRGR